MTEREWSDATTTGVQVDPAESARAAGLRYVSDTKAGIRREATEAGFVYRWPDGRAVDDPAVLDRIRSLAIPPAYTDVWICRQANGHLQATGRDQKGRKQYRYHPRWRTVRDETKYTRMLAFGKALPLIRAQVEQDLRLPGLPRAKVLATVVRLLEATLIRVGNAEYAKTNKSFGLTTLRDRHVTVEGSRVRFSFRGKSGKSHTIDVRDRKLARIVQQCRDLPGYELFQYVAEDGTRQTLDSADVNTYLQTITGEEFTAKDFRTWAGTVLAALTLREFAAAAGTAPAKKDVVQAIERVAEQLGNTPSICRKCYVHPAVIDAYLEGALLDTLQQRVEDALADSNGLDPDESAVLHFLHQRLAAEELHDQGRVQQAKKKHNRKDAKSAKMGNE